ncbi:phospholipase D-like domain-containing protein [Paracoccus sp. SCSIO 75233]|uniref:phospholipase D-like domain-containing protein n=1 Tax=Paracoccus sp. SCSIO 75233 TaxID=3017782 RepID=UPI0022F092C3|nr:phospholipase D-like domain-containing protein [Paracoccus sp. SCSIO 75233]WBU52612.1 phospholipase D-like domain-containing protein [Paracoccus sp. SCSIO 75233]
MDGFTFTPGRNCWRVELAERFAVIVDGADYFRALREALLLAEDVITLVGWDFAFEIEMLPGESDQNGNAPDSFPNQMGPFLDALAEHRRELEIYLLKWSGGALIAPGGIIPTAQIKLLSPEQVHLGFDGRHPVGACHHQKIVVVDDSLAFCGGIDVTHGRWDERGHPPQNPLRADENGKVAQPWHDVATMMSGPAAAALGHLCRARWQRAQDNEIAPAFRPGRERWPDSISPDFTGIDIAIARTQPPEHDSPSVNEVERLYLDSIRTAKRFIYLESQYCCSDVIMAAIRRRLEEPDGPEIVIINPKAAQGVVEDEAMHVTRSRFIRELRRIDRHGRFRIMHPVNEGDEDIYVHAKVSIIDDCFLRVGSSNIDRRSMGFDTECDVAFLAANDGDRQRIRDIRNGLLAEHLDCEIGEVAREIERGGMISAIETLNSDRGRRLSPIRPRKRESLLGSFLADTQFFDPRYRRSAQARLGITSRHIMLGAAALAAGAYLLSRRRGR